MSETRVQRFVFTLSLAVVCTICEPARASSQTALVRATPVRANDTLPGEDLFTRGSVHTLRVELDPSGVRSLRSQPRQFVRANVREGSSVFTNVAVHLKGAVGSFRPLDDKPGLTLDFSRFTPGQRFHGLRRIHLDNSVEDPSYANAVLGSELFRAAGVPAARISHAIVSLNQRELGLYLLREGFTEDFLACHFKDGSGNLYEPMPGHDIDQPQRPLSTQARTPNQDALKELARAASDGDLARRWQSLERILDMDKFVPFVAMEILLCHRDGYSLARNNFRVYEDPGRGKIAFLPHGMDQLLGQPELSWRPFISGIAARAVLETPEGKARYRHCFASLLTNVFQVDRLQERVDQIVASLRPHLTASQGKALAQETTLLKERIAKRQASLTWQLSQPELEVMVFSNGVARLEGWTKFDEPPGGKVERSLVAGSLPVLRILTVSDSFGSWRTKALLNHGRYRFEGRARVTGVKALPFGKHQGAGLRVSGNVRQSTDLVGDSPWQTLAAEFEVSNDAQEVEFMCELRASAGEALFDIASLQVVHLQSGHELR